MASQSKRDASYKPGLWLAILVVFLVGGWRFGVVAGSRHLLAVATEAGSVGQFRGNLFANVTGSRLIFSRETETGVGTFFCETSGGKTKLLFEHPEKGFELILGMISWAPDDSLFACNVQSGENSTHPKDEIILYDGTSGEVVQKIPANGYVWGSKFIWLSPRSFAFSTYNQAWLVFDKESDGTWVQTQTAKRFAGDESKNLLEISNLTATSAHSIAWQQGDGIWTHDFVSDSTQRIWESTTNKLESFTYQAATGDCLLQCSDEQGPLSICFRPPRLQEDRGTILAVTRGENRTRYVDLSLDHGRYVFAIKTGANLEPSTCR
jgi:hypothetical protein